MKKKIIIPAVAAVMFIALITVTFLPIFGGGEYFSRFEKIEAAAAVDYNSYMPENSAESAIVIDAAGLSVIYSKNADDPRGMASTTKIMTALVIIENCDPEDEFAVPKEAVGIEGSSVYLKEGEPLTVKELLYCLMLESGNDAATALALYCGGSIEGFTEMMNARAEELGLTNSHFTNPHGLSDGEHYTTARDLAVITAEAMKYPLFREIVSCKTARVRYDGNENSRPLVNHNKLLFNYEGAVGIKTGYTQADGRCLVSCAERNGLMLIAVTLSDPAPTFTHRMLLDATFEQYEQKVIAEAGELTAAIPVENSENEYITVCNPEKVSLCLPKGADVRIELIVPQILSAPIEEGEIIARAVCYYGDTEVCIINLESTETMEVKRKSIWDFFGK